MVVFFIGGAIGSAVAGFSVQHGGWMLVCASGAVFATVGLIVLFATTRILEPSP